MKTSNIYNRMTQKEILDLIQFSPNNLKEFFDNAFTVIEGGVPTYGVLLEEPTAYLLSDSNSLLTQDEIKELV
jgi:hypothetical protein